jgi:hypothetical protein
MFVRPAERRLIGFKSCTAYKGRAQSRNGDSRRDAKGIGCVQRRIHRIPMNMTCW